MRKLLAIILLLILQGIGISAIVDDFTFHSQPTMDKPAKGIPYTDPVFGTTITRITDAKTEQPMIPIPARTTQMWQGYPLHDIENVDGTMLIMQMPKYPCNAIYDAKTFKKIKDLSFGSGTCDGGRSPRWDKSDPNILYFNLGSKFQKIDVLTGERTVLHDFKNDFPGKTVIIASMKEKGQPSLDQKYWAFALRTKRNDTGTIFHGAVVYDKDENKIVSQLWEDGNLDQCVIGKTVYTENAPWPVDTKKTCGSVRVPKWVSLSPSGNYVLIDSCPKYLYTRDFKSMKILGGNCHSDWAFDDSGREVIVTAGLYWKTKYKHDGQWIYMIDVETGQSFYLGPLDSAGYHLSANSVKPLAIASVYDPRTPVGAEQCTPYTKWSEGSVIGYELTRRVSSPSRTDHAKVTRFAHARLCRQTYADAPFAKINRLGTKIWFGTAWDKALSKDNAADVYQIDLK